MNIKEMLEKTAREVPQKTAIVLGSQRVSYQELDEGANRVANALISLGMKKGDHVAVLMSHCPEWLINYFGLVKAGGIVVILNSMLKAPELGSLLRHSDSKTLITEKSFSQMLSSVLPTLPLLKHVFEVDGDPYQKMIACSFSTSPPVDIRDDDEVEIVYTSGVLGKRKGVVHTHASLSAVFPVVSSCWEQERKDVIIDPIPFFYHFGTAAVAPPSIMKGSTIVIIPRPTPRALLEAIDREKGTIIVGVPAMFNALAMLDDETLKSYDLSSLRVAFTGGAKSSPYLSQQVENKLGVILCEGYGLTECTLVSIGTTRNRKFGTAGKPAWEIKIVDDNGKEVPRGETGEAVAKAPWIMKEYYKAPDLTAQVVKDGWFHTGDLVRMDEEGYIEYVEKKSFIIVTSAGVKIPPTEVEDVLLTHPSVAEVAYVGVMDELKGQIPTLFVVPKEGQTISKKGIREFCRQNLANYKLPHKIEFVESIPKTGSGKIDRKRLKEGKIS